MSTQYSCTVHVQHAEKNEASTGTSKIHVHVQECTVIEWNGRGGEPALVGRERALLELGGSGLEHFARVVREVEVAHLVGRDVHDRKRLAVVLESRAAHL